MYVASRVVEDRDRNMKDGVWGVFTSPSENCSWEQGSPQLSQVHRTPALPPQAAQGSTGPKVSKIVRSPELGGLGRATTGDSQECFYSQEVVSQEASLESSW